MKSKLWLLLALPILTMSFAGCGAEPAREAKPPALSAPEGDESGEAAPPSEADEAGEPVQGEAPDGAAVLTVCADFFSAYAALDGDTAGRLLQGGSAIRFSQLHGALSRHVSAELGACATDGSAATVAATVTNADIAAIVAALPESIASQEEATAAMIEALDAPGAPTAVFDVTLSLVRDGGEWRIEMTPELSDALLGGYYTLLNSMAQTVAEEGKHQ